MNTSEVKLMVFNCGGGCSPSYDDHRWLGGDSDGAIIADLDKHVTVPSHTHLILLTIHQYHSPVTLHLVS